MAYKIVRPDHVVIEVWTESGQALFEVVAHVGDKFLELRAGEGEVCFNPDEIPAVIAVLQRAKDILDKGLDPVIGIDGDQT